MRQHLYVLVALFFLVVAGPVSAQNLVPNPGFETYSACPADDISTGGIDKALPWNKPTDGTADYFNTCSIFPLKTGVPSNLFGNQTPHAGNAYAGFTLYMGSHPDLREYIQAPLLSSLAAGQSYRVSFYVSLADVSKWAIDGIGAYFSNGPVGQYGPPGNPWHWVLPLIPQVSNPSGNVISNKTSWVLVQGTFIANGGESHLIVGNFKDGTSTTKQAVTGTEDYAYYYIDDVSVEPVKASAYDLKGDKARVGPNYVLRTQNVGVAIQGPAEIKVIDQVPPGVTLTGGSWPGWTCSPWAPPVVGSATITCTFQVNATIAPGAFLPDIKFQIRPGPLPEKPNCMTARLYSKNVAGNYVSVNETNLANNTACAK